MKFAIDIYPIKTSSWTLNKAIVTITIGDSLRINGFRVVKSMDGKTLHLERPATPDCGGWDNGDSMVEFLRASVAEALESAILDAYRAGQTELTLDL